MKNALRNLTLFTFSNLFLVTTQAQTLLTSESFVFSELGGAQDTSANSTNSTPLHIASQNGKVQTVKVLIESGADVNAVDVLGETPLHRAVRFNFNSTIALLLLKAGANIEAQTRGYFKTPLHYAAESYEVEIVDVLLKFAANVHAQDDKGYTALHLASPRSEEIVLLLLKAHADVNALAKDERTPLTIAVRSGNYRSANVLLDSGAEVESLRS